MKRVLFILLLSVLVSSCMTIESNPYSGRVNDYLVRIYYPDGFKFRQEDGLAVVIEKMDGSTRYTMNMTTGGRANFSVPAGLWRVIFSDKYNGLVFSAGCENVVVTSNYAYTGLDVEVSDESPLVISEIFPGNDSTAQHIILHNNSADPISLDGLHIAPAGPLSIDKPGPQCEIDSLTGKSVLYGKAVIKPSIYDLGLEGQTLNPGKSKVVFLSDARDHLGKDFSLDPKAPSVVLFSYNGGIDEYLSLPENYLKSVTGEDLLTIPGTWLYDAVEVFPVRISTMYKRMPAIMDAGYVRSSGGYLRRSVNLIESSVSGILKYQDTNNSSSDFYESTTPYLLP